MISLLRLLARVWRGEAVAGARIGWPMRFLISAGLAVVVLLIVIRLIV